MRLVHIFYILLAYFTYWVVIGIAETLVYDDIAATGVIVGIEEIVAAFVVVILCSYFSKIKTENLILNNPKGIKTSKIIAYGIACFFILVCVSIIFTYIENILEIKSQYIGSIFISFRDSRSLGETAVLFIAYSFISPISEEVFSRGFAYRIIKSKYNIASATIISSLLFSVLHFEPFYMAITFVVGVCLAITYEASGSLLSPVIAHVLFNTVNIIGNFYTN